MFEVRLTKTAEEDLQEFTVKTQASILEKIKILQITPFPTIKPIKKIKGSKKIPLFRLRIGSYRAISPSALLRLYRTLLALLC